MSAETKRALDEAIAAHIQNESESSAIVTGYIMYASFLTAQLIENGATRYFSEYADQQPLHVATGLAAMHVIHLDDDLRRSWNTDDE